MMKRRYTYWAFCCLLLMGALFGCAEDERLMFTDDTSVYFTNSDSLNYSFAFYNEEIQRDTFYLQCRITGTAVDRDRRVNIVAEEQGDAKRGYHYDVLDAVISAGRYADSIPVVVYRRSGLQDSLVTAFLRISDSEDLLAGYNDTGQQPVSRDKYSRQVFKFTITDQLIKPANWDSSWLPVFGEYSEVKYRFISNATNSMEWTNVIFPQDRNFIVQTAYYALYEYEQANGDLIDENGNPVKFY